MRCQIALGVLLWGGGVSTAAAQQTAAIPGRLEMGAGVLGTGAQSLGLCDANLTAGTGSGARRFSPGSVLMVAAGFSVQVSVNLSRVVVLGSVTSSCSSPF